MVITRHHQHPTMARTARRVAVLEHVSTAVYPGPLAVPDAEHAIHLGAGKQVQLLGAPD